MTPWKFGDSYWKPSFLGAKMLVLGRVSLQKCDHHPSGYQVTTQDLASHVPNVPAAWTWKKTSKTTDMVKPSEMDVSLNGGTQVIHFSRVFHYKPSILWYHHFWKPPNRFTKSQKQRQQEET